LLPPTRRPSVDKLLLNANSSNPWTEGQSNCAVSSPIQKGVVSAPRVTQDGVSMDARSYDNEPYSNSGASSPTTEVTAGSSRLPKQLSTRMPADRQKVWTGLIKYVLSFLLSYVNLK
jgi:hypothetical protein